jgi:hypothetical protein
MADKLSSDGLKSAADLTKQIISLSTGVIALTVTFIDKTHGSPDHANVIPTPLSIAWILFGLTIVAAIWTLGAVTGSLDALDRAMNDAATDKQYEAAVTQLCNSPNIRIPALAMVAFFLAAMASTILTGFLAVH